jgi:hypothetical protein
LNNLRESIDEGKSSELLPDDAKIEKGLFGIIFTDFVIINEFYYK